MGSTPSAGLVMGTRAGDLDPGARLALDVYCQGIRRAGSLRGLDLWAIAVDARRNGSGPGARVISPDSATVAVRVVPTDEELAIARDVADLIGSKNEDRQRSRTTLASRHELAQSPCNVPRAIAPAPGEPALVHIGYSRSIRARQRDPSTSTSTST